MIESNEPVRVSLWGKFGCGLMAGLIVMAVSSVVNRSYDTAEAAGAAQVRIAVAEAEAEAEETRGSGAHRGVQGMASADHDWVFGN
ncbi:MAG: hypothetical protein AAGA25_03760 [Planctomycetota bacterium]